MKLLKREGKKERMEIRLSQHEIENLILNYLDRTNLKISSYRLEHRPTQLGFAYFFVAQVPGLIGSNFSPEEIKPDCVEDQSVDYSKPFVYSYPFVYSENSDEKIKAICGDLSDEEWVESLVSEPEKVDH